MPTYKLAIFNEHKDTCKEPLIELFKPLVNTIEEIDYKEITIIVLTMSEEQNKEITNMFNYDELTIDDITLIDYFNEYSIAFIEC